MLVQPRLRIRRLPEAFVIEENGGRALTYVYFGDRRDVPHGVQRPTEEEAGEIARTIARALSEIGSPEKIKIFLRRPLWSALSVTIW
jgi:hypothetical protein